MFNFSNGFATPSHHFAAPVSADKASAKCIESCFKSFRALIAVISSLKDPKYEDRVEWAITILDSIMIEDEVIRVLFSTMDTSAHPALAPARAEEIHRHVRQVAPSCLPLHSSSNIFIPPSRR